MSTVVAGRWPPIPLATDNDRLLAVNTTITRDSSGKISKVIEGNITSTITRDVSGHIATVKLAGDVVGLITVTRDTSGKISTVTVA